MLTLTYKFPGDEAVQMRDSFVRFGAGLTKPFQAVDARAVFSWFDKMEQEQFDTRGARKGGRAWPDLKESTLTRKRFGLPPMVDSGAMRGGLTNSSSSFALRDVSDDSIALGLRFDRLGMFNRTDGRYPIYHQAGSPKTNLPQRRVVWLTEDDGLELMKIVQGGLVRLWKLTGKSGAMQ